MYKILRRVIIIIGLALIIIAFALVIYYNYILKDHSGHMDWWAVVLLVVPFAVMSALRIVLEFISKENSFNRNRILDDIFDTLLFLSLPFLFIGLIGYGIYLIFVGGNKRHFKKLIRKGYKFKREDKTYYLSKDEIIIKTSRLLDSFYISFDGGANYVRVEEGDLGEAKERENLSHLLNEYLNAHPVDIQRRDAVPPVLEFVDFLDKYLE